MVEKFIPSSKEEALEILSKNDCYIFAGGSDLMVLKKNTAGELPKFDKPVLYVAHLDELNYVKEDKDGVHIGATSKMSELEDNPKVPSLLRKAMKELASVNIRHFATLIGNIANASPAGDTTVVDVLLDAKLKLESKSDTRFVNAEDFVLGVRKIDRRPDELITEIVFPKHNYDYEMWYKVGSRKADSISKVSVAGYYKLNGDKVEQFALAFGSVSIKVCRDKNLEKEIVGLTIDELKARREEFIDKYSQIIKPIDDHRSNAEYRRMVAKNICAYFIDKLLKKEVMHELH